MRWGKQRSQTDTRTAGKKQLNQPRRGEVFRMAGHIPDGIGHDMMLDFWSIRELYC